MVYFSMWIAGGLVKLLLQLSFTKVVIRPHCSAALLLLINCINWVNRPPRPSYVERGRALSLNGAYTTHLEQNVVFCIKYLPLCTPHTCKLR